MEDEEEATITGSVDTDESKVNLPLARIRTIMRSCPDSDQIGQRSVLVIAKATEWFIKQMARDAVKKSHTQNSLDYKDLAEVVDGDDKLEFLSSIIPKKLNSKEAIDQVNSQEDSDFDSSEGSDEVSKIFIRFDSLIKEVLDFLFQEDTDESESVVSISSSEERNAANK